MRSIAASLMITLLMVVTTRAQPTPAEAPFGLTWGMSAEQVQAQGVTITEIPEQKFGKSFAAKSLPKVIGDTELVHLSFGNDNKLWRIAAVSKSTKDDPYGSAIKLRYDDLAAALAEKYGRGTQEHFAAKFHEHEHFVMGIKSGDNWWYTNFASPVVTVQIGIGATDFTSAHWLLIYSNKGLSAGFDKSKREREKSAL